tara:strand:+ start:58 stop:747 length:690 start_codon:yes stop_codon:yes gene_type:complete
MKTIENKVEFFSPFGPKLLFLELEDNIRLKLLDYVNQLRQSPNKSDQIIIHGEGRKKKKGEPENTVVDGEMFSIEQQHQEKHGNIVADTLTNLIELYAKKYYKEIGVEEEAKKYEYIPTNCWYVVLKAGDFHRLHNHKVPDKYKRGREIGEVSGSIYLDIPENLQYPQGNIQWVLSGREESLARHILDWTPRSGDALVWPSWLMHTVSPFRGNEERIMISFNGVWSYNR